MYWLIFLGVLIAILWLVKWGIIVYAIVSPLFCGGHNDSGGGCPFGYDISAANLIVLFTNTAGANEKIDDRLLLPPPWKVGASRVLTP